MSMHFSSIDFYAEWGECPGELSKEENCWRRMSEGEMSMENDMSRGYELSMGNVL